MLARGKLAVVLMLGLAVVLGGYAWWQSYERGRRSLALWGSDVAYLIRYAPQVELMRLAERESAAAGAASDVVLDGRTWTLSEPLDISRVRGLVHARHALVEDASFDWAARAASPGRWTYALRFRGVRGAATLAFDDAGRLRLLGAADRAARLRAPLRDAFQQRFETWQRRATEGPGTPRPTSAARRAPVSLARLSPARFTPAGTEVYWWVGRVGVHGT